MSWTGCARKQKTKTPPSPSWGIPCIWGWWQAIYETMNWIMLGTGILIPILLFIAYRSVMAAIFVPLAAVVSGIWGLGFYRLHGL